MTKKIKITLITAFVVIILGVISIILSFINNNTNNGTITEEQNKVVQTMILTDETTAGSINTVGVASANSKVDVTSLTMGKVKGIYFNDGQYVAQGNIMVVLGNDSIDEQVESAEIALRTATDNLNNAKALQTKNFSDLKSNAIVQALDYLSTIDNTLDDIDYIIKVDGDLQLEGIADTLSVKSPQSLINAKSSYLLARENYTRLTGVTLNFDNIVEKAREVVENLSQTRKVVDDLIQVLDNTVPSGNFSESSLLTQETYFNSQRASLAITQSTADMQLQSFENIALNNKTEINALENLIDSAQNQLQLAQIAKDKLIIKSPIAGKVTKKNIEVGDEINPNQVVSTISQTNTVKIEIGLSPEDVSFIKSGQAVVLDSNFIGVVSNIGSIAAWDSKKVKVDIVFNNTDNRFIPGTFVDVEIPVNKLVKTNESSVFVPLKAVTITQSGSFVFITEGNIARKKEVIKGNVYGSLVEITQGLKIGDSLIVAGSKLLEDGEEVLINNQ